MRKSSIKFLALAAVLTGALHGQSAVAQKKYDAGASDTEIKVGNTMSYSGPASSYSVIAKVEDAYFRMINDGGGINERKIRFISYDDGLNPSKTVEQTRKLIEGDDVLLTFNGMGTAAQSAVQKYQNAKKVPQLFVASGAGKWDNPKDFPWSIGFQPNNKIVARIYAKYILAKNPNAKVAILYQNDDFGKDFLNGLNEVFGDRASKLVVAQASFEATDPTVDSQVAKLMASNADVFVNVALPKHSAQAIKRAFELNWKPLMLVTPAAISINGVMKPAGFDAAEGIVGANFMRDAGDPKWDDDPAMKRFRAFIDKYMPGADTADTNIVYGYACAQLLVKVLEQAGDDLTRDNVMKQVAHLKDVELDTLLPGIKINTSPTDYAPIKQLQIMQFTKGKWELIGNVLSAEDAR